MLRIQKGLKIGPVKTSEKEIKDLITAWVAISLAFGIIISRSFDTGFYLGFIISSLTVGIAFIFHELSHKLTAQKYGCFAEFRSNNFMLGLAVIIALLFNFVFAAPGAVIISGPVGKTRNGKISLAGPLANLILGAALAAVFLISTIQIIKTISIIGFFINSLLALFNLIPILNFDGKKILNWNKAVYTIMIASSIILFIASQYLLNNFLNI